MTASDPRERRDALTHRHDLRPLLHHEPSMMDIVIDRLTVALLIVDRHQHCTLLNRAAQELTGSTAAELHGWPLADLLDLRAVKERGDALSSDPVAQAIEQQQRIWRDAMLKCKDGRRVPVTASIDAIGAGDACMGVWIELHPQTAPPIAHSEPPASTQEIADIQKEECYKHALAALQIEHSQLARVFEQAPAAIATMRGPDHIFEMANPRYFHIIGHRDIIGKSVREALPELVEQGFVALLDQVYHTGEPFVAHHMSARVQREPDGPLDECVVDFVYQPLCDPSGAVYGILAHIVDVTEWIRTQQQHAHLEARYQYLIATLPHSVYLVDTNGMLLEVNAAGERLLGRTSEEMVGHHFRDFIAPDDLAQVIATFEQLMTGEAHTIELAFHVLRPSGERRLAQVAVTAMQMQNQLIGLLGTARDITDERARDERMHLLSMVLEEIEQGVALMDKDYIFRFANPAGRTILGIPAQSKDRFHIKQFLPDAAGQREFAAIISTLHETGHWNGRIRRRRLSDGQILQLDMMKGIVLGADGQPLYFSVFQDASDAIQREQRLRRAERLASLGTLISGVAHELNNPLTTIIGCCDLLLMEPHPEQEHDDIQTIHHEAQRMARIVADLRVSARYTQEQNQPKGPVDLNAVVRHVLKLRAYRLQTGNITVQAALADDLSPVYGDTAQLEQVMLNVVINAEQAMQTSEKEHRLMIRTLNAEDRVLLEISDTGSGIEPTHLERLFDPFFTTKAPGEGTGLGLSLVHSLVQEHGGSIDVDSAVGSGTTFRVHLRAARDRVPDMRAIDAPLPATPQRLLLVDDEVGIREVLARFLRQRGHEVDTASNGTDALRLLEKHSYDCIVSDLRMPGMHGEQLLAHLREYDPRPRCILLTGDATSDVVARLHTQESVEVLLKPISPSEVARVIEGYGKKEA